MDDYSGAWRPVNKAEWEELKSRGERVSWAEGVGLIVYDQQALDEFKNAVGSNQGTTMSSNRDSTPVVAGVREALKLVDERLEDLAVANAVYGKDQQLSAPDKIERNNRETHWLKNIRSILASAGADKSDNPVQGAESASGAHVAGRTAGANPATGATLSTDQRREEIVRIIKDHCSVRVQGEHHAPRDGLQEAADAILALDGSDWIDIATAPKDGRDILLASINQVFRGEPVPDRVTIGHWTTEEECREQIGDCGGECRCPEYKFHEPTWLSWDGGFTKENPPTHWKPLPAPPATAGKEG